MEILKIFKRKPNESHFFKKLGKHIHIRNGKSWFVSSDDNYLVDNCYLQIGFGRSISGYGDWGGGFSRASTSPLKVVIDKNYVIQKIETDSFYNSDESKKIEKEAKKLASRLKVGDTLTISNEEIKKDIYEVLKLLPHPEVISWDYFEYPHMKPKKS